MDDETAELRERVPTGFRVIPLDGPVMSGGDKGKDITVAWGRFLEYQEMSDAARSCFRQNFH